MHSGASCPSDLNPGGTTSMTPFRSPAGTLSDLARTVLVLAWGVPVTLARGTQAIRTAARGGGAPELHGIARTWARSILRASGVRVAVSGIERIAPGRAHIFMANHSGNYDIPVLLAHLPAEFRWVAKTELFRIPVFGRAMHAIGCIPIDRSDRESAFGSLHRAGGVLASGTSIMMFPEGTRSVDGTLLPFKKGGFMLALASGVPIVPVALRGVRAVMPKGRLRVRGGAVELSIQDPIATSGMQSADRDDLMRRVRTELLRALAGR